MKNLQNKSDEKKTPPNLRRVDVCALCSECKEYGPSDFFCHKYGTEVNDHSVCDDFPGVEVKKRKIIVNRCSGGLGISMEAKIRLIEMDSDIVEKTDFLYPEEKNVGLKEIGDYLCSNSFNFIIKGDVVYRFPRLNKYREHPDIIKIIEEMKELANCYYSKLEIIEIPENIEWEVEEYDGIEWISEKHRKW